MSLPLRSDRRRLLKTTRFASPAGSPPPDATGNLFVLNRNAVRLSTAILVLLAASFRIPAGAEATEPDSDDPPDPDALPVLRSVVRAPRPAQTAGEVLVEVDPDTVPLAGATAADLLEHAPSLLLVQHGGEGKAHQIFLRGFDAVHGQDVALDVGGIPANEVSHIHGQGYADLHYVIPEVVRHLRVIEGPFQPHQGEFALAGSAHYTLGLDRAGSLARVSGGQFGLLRMVVAHRPGAAWAEPSTFVAGEMVRGDGFGPERAHLRGSLLGQLGLHLSGPWEMRVLAGTYGGRFATAGVIREDDLIEGRIDRLGTYREGQGGTSVRHQALVEVAMLEVDTRVEASAWGALTQHELRHDFTGFLEYPEGDLSLQRHDARSVGLHANVERRGMLLERRLVLTGGVEGRVDRVGMFQARLDDGGDVHTTEIDLVSDVGRLSGFGELRWHVAPWLVLRAGGRVDALSIRSRLAPGSAGPTAGLLDPAPPARALRAGPRLTAEWRPFPRRTFFLSYGSGFRPVHTLDLEPDAPAFTEARSVELGSRFGGRRVRIATSIFTTHVANDLVFDHAAGRNVASGPTLRTGNVIQARVSLGAGLRLHGAASFVHAIEADTGDLLPHVPPVVGRLGLDGERPLALRVAGWSVQVFAGARIHGFGGRPLPLGERGDPVLLTDAWGGVSIGDVRVSVEATNLTGARWWDGEYLYASRFDPGAPVSGVPARHVTAGRPRTVQGTLSVRF